MKPLPLLATFVLLLSAATTTHAGGDKVWSAVILATREHPAKPIPEKLEDFATSLRRIFGYNTFYLLGEKTKNLREGVREWLVPSRRIFLSAVVLAASKTDYTMRLSLYDGKNLLVTTEARLARDAPLYIRGPQWGKGQLIILLEVR